MLGGTGVGGLGVQLRQHLGEASVGASVHICKTQVLDEAAVWGQAQSLRLRRCAPV